MKTNVKITKLLNYVIPYFGNNHYMPYFTAEVTDGNTTKVCKSKGDKIGDNSGYQYITFNRKRYKVVNNGSMYHPILSLILVEA